MVNSELLLFLELQKTGSSHIKLLMRTYLGGTGFNPRHARHEDACKLANLICGGIRHPLDWYLSFWTYGCDGRGGLLRRATTSFAPNRIRKRNFPRYPFLPFSPSSDQLEQHIEYDSRRDAAYWKRLHRSASDPAAFQEWLFAIHDDQNRYTAFEDYGYSPWFGQLGMYSYLTFYLYVENIDRLFSRNHAEAGNIPELIHDCKVQRYIRSEHLENDFIAAAREAGYFLTPDIISAIRNSPKTNTSNRKGKLAHFYDDSTLDLIQKLDGPLANFHGYSLTPI